MGQFEIQSAVIGRGQYGTVHSISGDLNLCAKIQYMKDDKYCLKDDKHCLTDDKHCLTDDDSVPTKASHTETQHELAAATIAGEIGVGPRIYQLTMCDMEPPLVKITWVMDKITGSTLEELLGPQLDHISKGIPYKEYKLMKEKIVEPYYKQLLPLIKMLNNRNIIIKDIHEGNVMFGSIRGGPPRLWIIDYGKARILTPPNKPSYDYQFDSPYCQYGPEIFDTSFDDTVWDP